MVPGYLRHFLFLYLQFFNNKLQTFAMQELMNRLKSEAGLTDEQAKQAIATIKAYVVEKFPMLESAVNNVFGGE